MSNEIKINKKTLIIVLISILLIGSIIFTVNLIKTVSAVGICSGSARCPRDEQGCFECGCEWDWELSRCFGIADPCSSHTDVYGCEECGCTWTEGPENFYINVADSWLLAQDVFVNVGDVWQDAEAVYVNVGDVWRLIYST